METFLFIGGIGLLIGCYAMSMRRREQRICTLIEQTNDPAVASKILDMAIEEDAAITEFWKEQNPRGGL